jgi:hypothetical protein
VHLCTCIYALSAIKMALNRMFFKLLKTKFLAIVESFRLIKNEDIFFIFSSQENLQRVFAKILSSHPQRKFEENFFTPKSPVFKVFVKFVSDDEYDTQP